MHAYPCPFVFFFLPGRVIYGRGLNGNGERRLLLRKAKGLLIILIICGWLIDEEEEEMVERKNSVDFKFQPRRLHVRQPPFSSPQLPSWAHSQSLNYWILSHEAHLQEEST